MSDKSGIKMTSDWGSRVRRALGNATTSLAEAVVGPMTDLGETLRQDVTDTIMSGTLQPGLAQRTIDKKGHSAPLLDTQEYVRSFRVSVRRFPLSKTIVVRVAPDTPEHQLVGEHHEYGTAHHPARPHWRPAVARLRADPRFRDFLRGKDFDIRFRE